MFKDVVYTADVVYFTLMAKDATGANIVLAVPRVSKITIAFADGALPIAMNRGDALTINFTGLTSENYNSLIAEFIPEGGGYGVQTDIVTRANPYLIIAEPVFVNGVCNSTTVTIKLDIETGGYEALLRVTLVDNDGKKYVASRIIMYFQSRLAAAAYNGGSYILTDTDATQANQIEIPAGKEFTLDLNGKTMGNTIITPIWDNAEGVKTWSLFSVRGKMTIKDGSGNDAGTVKAYQDDCYAIDVREGGHLIIEGGTYVGNIHAVYVHKGTADIRGGRFSVQQKDATHPTGYVINCFDANYQNGTAIVKISGGRYHGFNPADCPAEGPGTNFVIAGYQSQAYGIDGEGYTIYKVTSL
jgi:hypothetical protein